MGRFNSLATPKISSASSSSVFNPSSSKFTNQVATAKPSGPAWNGNTSPDYWLEKGMVWPIAEPTVPWGATDYASLVSWIGSAHFGFGGNMLMADATWYDGKIVSPMDLPIAYYPHFAHHSFPFLVWATPHVLPFWLGALRAVIAGTVLDGYQNFDPYSPTYGPLITANFLSNLAVSTPKGDSTCNVRYAGISPYVPPGNRGIFFGIG